MCLNKAMKHAHNARSSVCIPNLGLDTLSVIAYGDALLANNMDLYSRLGRVELLTAMSNERTLVLYRSYKSRRVALFCFQQKQQHSQD